MLKNEERISTVIANGMDGEGIIKDEDKTVFVPFAIKGEKVRYKVLKDAGNCVFGKLSEVITPAKERVSPVCPVFTKCGGCDMQHIRYKEQLDIKSEKVKNCFKKIANIDVEVLPVVESDKELRYRNKLQLPVGEDSNGKGVIIGFYARNSHRIVEVSDCQINPEWTATVISSFKSFMQEFSVHGYDETKGCSKGKAIIREITVKEINGNLIIVAVIPNKNLEHADRLIEILKENLKCEFSLYLNINETDRNNIFGEEFRLIYGKGEYPSEMFGINYKIGVRSFMQVNSAVCEKLYSAVNNAVCSDGNTTVIDAYSGAGLMTALLSKNAKNCIGIEIVKEAVELANQLAKDNGLQDKITNYCGKCEEILPKIVAEQKKSGNKIAIVLDPPRKGCDLKVVEAVKNSGADKIVYVSCKPSTLARDIGLIVGTLETSDNQVKRVDNPQGVYRIESVRPFDMFAQTKHVETLCVLEKIK